MAGSCTASASTQTQSAEMLSRYFRPKHRRGGAASSAAGHSEYRGFSNVIQDKFQESDRVDSVCWADAVRRRLDRTESGVAGSQFKHVV